MSLADTVTEILDRQGLTGVLTVRAVTDVDPATGAAGETYTPTSVVCSPVLSLRVDIDEFGGVPASARAILDASVAPTVGSRLGLSGAVYPIVAVRTVSNNEGVVAYIVALGDGRG